MFYPDIKVIGCLFIYLCVCLNPKISLLIKNGFTFQ